MMPASHPEDLLGAYALDACAPAEAEPIGAHLDVCPRCAAEVTQLRSAVHRLSELHAQPPPPDLRRRVLAAALAQRPARVPDVGGLLDPYVAIVGDFDDLLSGLSPVQWEASSDRYPTVRDLVAHLADNDRLVLRDLGSAPGRDERSSGGGSRRHWRESADSLIRTVARADRDMLARRVRLAGAKAPAGPLREAMVQRVFETWIHADDVRGTLNLPDRLPASGQLLRIVDFGLRLLPAALDAAGRARPRQQARMILSGPRPAERIIDLSAARARPPGPDGEPVVQIRISADRFCKLMAGRVAVGAAGADVTGDAGAAADLLEIAATLGCD